jgi:hypothetical protein
VQVSTPPVGLGSIHGYLRQHIRTLAKFASVGEVPGSSPSDPNWLAVDTAGRRLFVSPGGDGHRILVYRYWHRIAKEHFSRGSRLVVLRPSAISCTRGFRVVFEHLCVVGRRSENSA